MIEIRMLLEKGSPYEKINGLVWYGNNGSPSHKVRLQYRETDWAYPVWKDVPAVPEP